MWTTLKQQIQRWRGVLITVPSVAGSLLLLRLTGSLQFMELAALDQMFRLRPAEPVDSRIVLVTIDESDIKQLGQWPMSDTVLARLITMIKQQQPQVIGLDIFRNLPVEPGHSELVNVFNSTPNLIGIEKVIKSPEGATIQAPPALKQRDQVSASDLVLDADGRIRRSLLYLRTPDNRSIPTLGTLLALTYLEAKGIDRQPLNREETKFRLGQAIVTTLQANDGGYVNVDDGGYQILSNFPKFQKGFRTISITEVLNGRMPRDLVRENGNAPLRDRIVLIGLTAESVEGKFFTSYSTNSKTAPSGVEVHALLASQLLGAALDYRPLLNVWSDPIEWLWIVGWSTIGGVMGWTSISPRQTATRTVLLGTALLGSAYLFFLLGWWIIIVPPLLALVGSAITSNGYLMWENLKQYAQTLEQRVEERTLELGQEIVDRTQAEETLSQQRHLLQTIVDNIPVMMMLYSTEGQVEFVNRQLGQTLSLTKIDQIAAYCQNSEQCQQILAHLLATNDTWLDLKIKTANNQIIHTSWATVQLADQRFVGIGQDISDRKRAEESSILDERNRMAREIHDTLAQTFTGILLHIRAAKELMLKKPESAQTQLSTVDELAQLGLDQARRSVTTLRPKLLEERDLYRALNHLTTQMQSSTQIHFSCEVTGTPYVLPSNVEDNLFRIGQEALTNAVKHANATEICIELTYEETQCFLRIKDNGQGFEIDQMTQGFGLLGMSERAEQIGGELILQGQLGQGAEVIVIVNQEPE